MSAGNTNTGMIKRIQCTQALFRILDDWFIEYDPKNKMKAECSFNEKTKKATIYAFGKREIPKDYIYHEMLHIAFAAVKSIKKHNDKREAEEILVQDICASKIR